MAVLPESLTQNDVRIPERISIRSHWQPAGRTVRLLAPRDEQRRDLKIVYLLPVEPASWLRLFGDPVREARKLDLATRHGVVFAVPDFAQSPWYADHPDDPRIAQEKYFLDSVCPQVEQSLGHEGAACQRYLLGFSKSGRGAWSLLLRNPDRFAGAFAWDAPLMMEDVNLHEAPKIFGSQENFGHYCLPRLLTERKALLGANHRLCIGGYGLFREHGQRMHELLDRLAIPHRYADGPKRRHHWSGGWLDDAVSQLLQP